MPFSHVQERAYAISRIPQTDFATVTAAVTVPPLAFVEMLVKDKELADLQPITKDNDGFSTRSDFPTEVYLERWDVTTSKEAQLEVDMAGRFLYGALGAVTTTQPAAGPSPTVYQHVFKPMAPFTGRQLPAYTLVEKVGASSLDSKYPSCVFEKLTISGDGTDRLSLNATLRGSGKVINPSAVNFGGGSNHVVPATGLNYLFNSQAKLAVSDYNTHANLVNYSTSCRFRNFEIVFDNSLLADDGYCPGNPAFQTTGDQASGQVRNELLFGKRNYTMRFLIRVDSATDERAILQQQKKLDILIEAEGGIIEDAFTYKLSIHIGLAQYSAAKVTDQNGIVCLDITPRILYDVTNGEVLDITLINKTASYTV